MGTRKLTTTLSLSLIFIAMLALTPNATYAAFVHKYITQITEVPATPGITSGPFGGLTGLAVDSNTLYVLDIGDVDEYDTTTDTFIRQISGKGLFGQLMSGYNARLGFDTLSEFSSAKGIAVDHASGEIFVDELGYEGYPEIFPDKFVGEGSGTIDVFGVGGEVLNTQGLGELEDGGVAVDNSTNPADPAAGDMYVSTPVIHTEGQVQGGLVEILKPEASGRLKFVAKLSGTPQEPRFPYQSVDMVAVDDANGDLIVGSAYNVVYVFRPTGPGTYEFLFELDGVHGEDFRKSENLNAHGAITGVAVDNTSGDFYVADWERGAVYEFTANGEYLDETTGTPGKPFVKLASIAVGSNGDLYVADKGAEAVDVFGPNIDLPDVVTSSQSANGRALTLSGSVNPSGTKVAACRFEFGFSESYGSQVPCASFPASGSSAVGVSATIPVDDLAPGSSYHYRLVAIDEEGETAYGRDETFVTAPAVVGSALASEITSFSATLTGVIEPGHVAPEYDFMYGLTSSYGSVWPGSPARTGFGSQQTVSQTLTGLQPDTTYHVALSATNFGGGESVSPDATFTTRPLVPPVVSTNAAEAVAQTTATLTGTVDPQGLPTTYRFEYGASTAYGLVWPVLDVYAGSGDVNQAVAISVPNLSPGTVYHYRIVASNEDGTTYGADGAFTTPSYPISLVQEPVGPSQATGVVSKTSSKTSKGSSGSHKPKPKKRKTKAKAKKKRGGRR